jgi:alpha-beta hydrolase superfamily lysophospholipase
MTTSTRWRTRVGLGAVVMVVLVSCTQADPGDGPGPRVDSDPPPTSEAGVGDLPTDVRTVPDPLPPGRPGDLVALAPRTTPEVPAGARAWDLLYRSEAVDGAPVAVSGVVYAPGGPAPEDGRPVVSWAHGTVGVADACAPSRAGVAVPDLARLLDAGYVVAATDYEGLGTPGPHPYLVGESEGRSVLDAARAAERIDGAGAGNQVGARGHSQGGQAALFAGILAPETAPDLELLGVIASAPAAELATLLRSASSISLGFGLLGSGIYAYANTYDELVLADVITPAVIDRIGIFEELCLAQLTNTFGSEDPTALLVADPLDIPAWAARVRQNEPGSARIVAPILVVQGTNDFIVVPSSTDTAVQRLCEGGDRVDYRRYPNARHNDVLAAAGPEILAWIADRVAGRNPASSCGG